MASGAKITEIEALARFRGSLREFEQSLRTVIDNLIGQANRGAAWIETDRSLYWPQQARLRGEQLTEAQKRLAQRRSLKVGDHEPACDDEKKQVYLAKQRLREANEKLELVQHWRRVSREEAHEFSSRLGKLQRWLDTDLPQALATLDRMVAALDQYSQRSSPSSAGSSTSKKSTNKESTADGDADSGATDVGANDANL